MAIKATQSGKPETTLYFNKSTNLLVKAAFRGRMPIGTVDREFIFGEFRETAGIKLPMKIVDYQGGLKMSEWKVTEYRFVERFDVATFKKP